MSPETPSSKGLDLGAFDLRDPRVAKVVVHEMTLALMKAGESRRVARKQAVGWVKLRRSAAPTEVHRLGSTQIEALAALRAMPSHPANDDAVDALAYRRDRNRRKRARRARRAA